MKKSEWLDCQRNEFFPKQKGIPSLVKIEHKNTATLDSARSKKKSKVAVLQLGLRGRVIQSIKNNDPVKQTSVPGSRPINMHSFTNLLSQKFG